MNRGLIGRTLDHHRIESKLGQGGMGVVCKAATRIWTARWRSLQFHDFATGGSTTVARNLGEIQGRFTASPDDRTILYTRVDSSVDDLMLVENFR